MKRFFERMASRRIRVAHKWGRGEWHSKSSMTDLTAWVDQGNLIYGAGTHWIERERLNWQWHPLSWIVITFAGAAAFYAAAGVLWWLL